MRDMARLAQCTAPEAVRQVREAGASAVRAFDYPHAGMEAWRHTHVGALARTPYESLLDAPLPTVTLGEALDAVSLSNQAVRLVFVDGFHRPDLSDASALHGATAVSLASAFDGDEAPRVAALLAESPQPLHLFEALNSAFLQDGAFIHAPANAIIAAPIHLLFITGRRPAQTAAHARILALVEANARIQLVTHHVALPGGESYFNTITEDLRLAAGASLTRTEIIGESPQGHRMAVCHVRQDRDSCFEAHSFTLEGGVATRNELRCALDGPGASTHLYGLSLNRGQGIVDNDASIVHRAPNCTSRIRYKGVLEEESHTVFTGKAYVAPEAQQTDSEQLCANMVLSDAARVDAKPQLEIYADDVRCTHGATVGGPSENEVFYLRSRGIGAAQARAMLIRAFASDAVGRAPEPSVRDWLERQLADRFQMQEQKASAWQQG